MSEYRFTIDRSNLEGKQGILKKDNDGYYNDVLVGAFNIANTIGEPYIWNQAVSRMFDLTLNVSPMIRWLKAGKLIGERDHPILADFISKDRDMKMARALWTARNGELKNSNKAMQIAGLDPRPMPDKVDGKTVIGIYAKIRPSVLELDESLQDRNSNTAFSMRSYIRRIFGAADVLREVTSMFTYDWVTTNGLPPAEKYKMVGCESETMGVPVDGRLIRTLDELQEDESLQVGCESSIGIITQVIKENGKWREVPAALPSTGFGRIWTPS